MYVLRMSTYNAGEVNANQAIRELEFIKSITGHEKFNLVGHSYGAPAARYIAGIRPDLVASVSMVGGTNDSNARDKLLPPVPKKLTPIAARMLNGAGMAVAFSLGIVNSKEACTTELLSRHPHTSASAKVAC